jgi:hypothetical protein
LLERISWLALAPRVPGLPKINRKAVDLDTT